MALDAVKNFAKGAVSAGYDSLATSIVLASGDGARFPDPSSDGGVNVVWWNSTDYGDPSDDPNREIVRVTARTTDTLTITRAQGIITFPADFLMVAAMNPPQFSAGSAQKIERRISAPLLDRIDLTIDVQPVPIGDLQRKATTIEIGETSASIMARVTAARKRQRERFSSLGISTNKEMNVKHIDTLCPLDTESEKLLKQAVERLGLSARSYHRTIKVARTIADLAKEGAICALHVAVALQYRQSIGVR